MCKDIKIKKQIIESMKNVEQQYYTSLVATIESSPKNIKRERNYCYEFYHQMRSNSQLMQLIEDDYTFSSEMDKSGHEIIKENLIPDFILHRPSKMTSKNKDNLLVMEVKVALEDIKGIIKDFNSLSVMISEYSYHHGIFILINHSLDELRKKFKRIIVKKDFKRIEEKYRDSFSKIDIICSKEMSVIGEVVTLEELYEEISYE